jgi:hypothetical protein
MALTPPEYAPQGAFLGMALGTTTVREGPSATPPQLTYALSWAGASINAPFPFRIDTVDKATLPLHGGGNLTVDYNSGVLTGVATQGPIAFLPYLGVPPSSPCPFASPAAAAAPPKVYSAIITTSNTRLGYPLSILTLLTLTVAWRRCRGMGESEG